MKGMMLLDRDDLLTSNISVLKTLPNELIMTVSFINRNVIYAHAHTVLGNTGLAKTCLVNDGYCKKSLCIPGHHVTCCSDCGHWDKTTTKSMQCCCSWLNTYSFI